MRTVINSQIMFGQIDISAIVFNPKSRDDIPKLLRGLQEIYTNIELRQRVFSILEEVRPERKSGAGKADMNNGRPGMEQWTIFVLGVLRLGLNIDYDRLQELVNHRYMSTEMSLFLKKIVHFLSGFRSTSRFISHALVGLDPQRSGYAALARCSVALR
jgi:hypothetical protein